MKRSLVVTACLCVALAACGSVATDDTSRHVSHTKNTDADPSWADDAVETTADMSDTINLIGTYATQGDLVATHDACETALDAVPEWQASVESYPAGVRAELMEAISDFYLSFTACVESDYSTAAADMRRGTTHIQAASALVAGS